MGEALEPPKRQRLSRLLAPNSRTRLLRLKTDPEAYALVRRVAKSRHVGMRALVSGGRGSGELVLARQLAMYLLHVLLRRPHDDIGRLLGRPRSTVHYACQAIEWLRDDDELLRDDIARIEAQGWGKSGETAMELRHAA